MSDEQKVFGLEVGWVLTDDEIPMEVLGCVKYIDAGGHANYWVFNSSSLAAVEAAGMSKLIDTQCIEDLQTHLYLTASRSNDDNDDYYDDEEGLEDA